jgi:hypothetical protein
MRPSQAVVRERVERLCSQPLAERDLRERVLRELRSVIDISYYAWLLTDPETWVGTAPLAHVPDLRELPRLIRLKYQATGNRWTSLPANRCVVRSGPSVPVRGEDAAWWDLLDGYGVTDLASLSLRDSYGSWSFLDLWRCGGARPRFSDREIDTFDSIARPLTRGVRQAQARSFSLPSGVAVPAGPAILILDEELHLRQHTSIVTARLRELLPTAPDLAPSRPPRTTWPHSCSPSKPASTTGLHRPGLTWSEVRGSVSGRRGSPARRALGPVSSRLHWRRWRHMSGSRSMRERPA